MEAILSLLGVGLFAVVGWVFNTHSKVQLLEQRDRDYITLINSQFADVSRRLDRIERIINHKEIL